MGGGYLAVIFETGQDCWEGVGEGEGWAGLTWVGLVIYKQATFLGVVCVDGGDRS
jgi:hypothetical protein